MARRGGEGSTTSFHFVNNKRTGAMILYFICNEPIEAHLINV